MTRLEGWCDEFNEELAKLDSFILPGGTPGAAYLHVARVVTRRAERSTWAVLEADPERTSVLPARYLNRLSDLLFILGRVANPGGDVLWVPGRGLRLGECGIPQVLTSASAPTSLAVAGRAARRGGLQPRREPREHVGAHGHLVGARGGPTSQHRRARGVQLGGPRGRRSVISTSNRSSTTFGPERSPLTRYQRNWSPR